MSEYNAKVHMDGPDELVIESGGSITAAGTQASAVSDFSADADVTITTDLTGVDTGTDMTAAQAAQIEADLAAIAAKLNGDTTDIETKLNAIIAALEGVGILDT